VSLQDETVTGRGIVDTHIKIINVSRLGEILGTGTVDEEGRFEIDLVSPLESKTLIGIQPVDPDLNDEMRTLPGATDIPFVGPVLATTAVP
jgi:hypothetical protein